MSVSIHAAQPTEKRETFAVREIIILLVLSCIQFTFVTDYMLLMPLGPELMKTFNVSPRHFSYLISVFTFSAAISGFLASFFIDRFDRKKALLVTYTCFCIGLIFTATSNSYYALLSARLISGASGGIITALALTILGDIMDSSKIGRATSILLSANAVAAVAGIPVAIQLSEAGGWKLPFYLLLAAGLLILIAASITIPSVTKHLSETTDQITSRRLLNIVTNPNFIWPLTFMSLLTLAGGFTILPFLSTYTAHNYRFSTEDIGLMFFMGGLGSFLSGPLTGSLSDKLGKQNVFLWLNFISIIPIMLLTVFPLYDKNIVLGVTTLFFIFSAGRNVSGMALINTRFDSQTRGRFISLNTSFQLLCGTLGTLLTGFLLYEENELIYNFDLIGIIAISATIICIFTAFLLDE